VRFTVEDVIAEGDLGAVRFPAEGTHLGELQGYPPSGRQADAVGRRGAYANPDERPGRSGTDL
jgi:hypothetical protein